MELQIIHVELQIIHVLKQKFELWQMERKELQIYE